MLCKRVKPYGDVPRTAFPHFAVDGGWEVSHFGDQKMGHLALPGEVNLQRESKQGR